MIVYSKSVLMTKLIIINNYKKIQLLTQVLIAQSIKTIKQSNILESV